MDKTRFDECLKYYYSDDGGSFWAEKAEEWGYNNKETLRSEFHRERKNKNLPTKDQKDSGINYIKKTSILRNSNRVSEKILDLIDGQEQDPEYLLQAHGYDPEKFELVEAKNELASSDWTFGESLKFYSRIVAKPRVPKLSLSDIVNVFKDLEPPKHPKPGKKKQYSLDGKVLEVNLADLHYGVQEIESEISFHERVENLIEEIIARVGSQKLSKIYFVLNGDTLHVDTASKTTTKGTRVYTDGSTPQNLLKEVTSLIIWAIDRLSTLAPVETFYVKGNHDTMLGYALIHGLSLYFKDRKDIVIDLDDKGRTARLIGVTLVGWVHGNISKKNLLHILQTEYRELWGKSKYAELHVGHYHHETTTEENGLVLRYLNSTVSPDGWHFDEGYTSSSKGTNCFLWDLETGFDSMWIIYV